MEREWMNSLDVRVKQKFMAKRYMDGVLLFLKTRGWDSERFYEDFKRSECYMPPLNLEEASGGTFLETSFRMQDGQLHYRLKNTNAGGERLYGDTRGMTLTRPHGRNGARWWRH